jgi:hypothetical protein
MNKQTESYPATQPDIDWSAVPIIAVDIPIMYEDEGQDEVGETDIHWRCCEILRNGLIAHFGPGSPYRVFSDLNLYYHRIDRDAYVSPDTFAVIPAKPLPEEVTSYFFGEDGPEPAIVMEVLSKRSAQQQDLTNKPEIYATLGAGVPEYILVDVTGKFLPQKLLLKRLQPDLTWADEQDSDGGVTSRLGFRVIIDHDGMIRLLNAQTGRPYPRPEETYLEMKAREQAELEKQQAELEKQQAEQEKQQAELEKQQAEQERQQAEQEKQQALDLVHQLEAELKKYRNPPKGNGPSNIPETPQ